MGIPWEVALGAVCWSGIIFLILSIFKIRTMIVQLILKQIRYAISAGIGLFIAFIGFVGLFTTSILVIKRVKGALIIGIIVTTILAIPLGRFYGDASEINFGVSTLVPGKVSLLHPTLACFLK